MAFTGPSEDRLAIRELYGTYSDAATRQDRDAYLACWHEDGVRADKRGEVAGKAAIAAQWDGLWQILEKMAFFAEVAAIEVEGDSAAARVFCREIIVLKDGAVWKIVGRYDDQLVRDGGGWRFRRRDYATVIDEGR